MENIKLLFLKVSVTLFFTQILLFLLYFTGTTDIFSKVNLFRCLDVMKGLFPDEFEFYPKTWFLPQQYCQFNAAVKYMTDRKTRPKPTFIVKPSDGSQGEGIYLLRDPTNYSQQGHRKHVVQEYLTNVLLIDDFKFDFRVYAVLKSIQPLEIHICKEGLARFSTIPYEQPNAKNLHESFMHLTNYSLNKRSETFNKSEKDNEGSKRKLTQVLNLLKRHGYDSDAIWMEIEQIVCKTILSVFGELKVEFQCALTPSKSQLSCFQILGFDIILLKNLKPMLLEVNSNPSLRIDSEQEVTPGVMEYVLSLKDEEVKRPLIRDTLMLVAPKDKFTRKRRKKNKVQMVIKREPTNVPTALVIMSETKDISERLLTFNLLESQPNNSPPCDELSDMTEQHSPNKSNSDNEDIAIRNTINQNLTDDDLTGESNINHKHINSSTSQSAKDATSQSSMDLNSNSESSNENSETSTYGETTNEVTESNEQANENSESEPMETEETNENEEESYIDGKIKDEKDREPSCLREIYPSLYGTDYHPLHLLEKMADMFMSCIGIRGSSRLSSSGFRLFTRKCKLVGKGITNATIDLIYIDLQRKWENLSQERGLNFAGFVDACTDLASRKFLSQNRLEMMKTFLDYCQENMDAFHLKQSREEEEKRTPLTRKQQSRTVIYPKYTAGSLGEATLRDLYGQSLRKEYVNFQHKKINAYMLANHKKHYQPRTRLDLKTKQDDT
ncbi:hypothetical protein SNE40_021304 [Patella caerulea]|uniref:Tubulin polyglutamylase TTLL11 n=1 Tax=Patella caerulea TaxID=87958 RepID=A0AAN8GCF8_PATCE